MELTRGPPVDRGIARMIAPTGMIISYATQAGHTAANGQGRNSPYTMAFLKNIETTQEIGAVFHHMTADVYNETQGKQLPELSLSYIGDYYLNGRSPAEASYQLQPATSYQANAIDRPQPRDDGAAQAWTNVKDTNSAEVLEAFIRRYPDGFYASLARAKLEQLKTQNSAPVVAFANPARKISFGPISQLTLLTDDTWVELQAGVKRWTFHTVTDGPKELVVTDLNRDLYLRFNYSAKRVYVRMGPNGPWGDFVQINQVIDERKGR
jgi:hypothetical protein